MFYRLNRWSRSRSAWLILALSALTLEIMALGLQYGWQLQPCVLCVYQRAGLAGIIAAGLVGAIAPPSPLRLVAILGWIIASAKTMSIAWEQTLLQLHPPLFATCDFMARFPDWLPLDRWLPVVFTAGGSCLDHTWTLLSLSMPQWVVGLTSVYLVVALLVLVAQLPRFKRNN